MTDDAASDGRGGARRGPGLRPAGLTSEQRDLYEAITSGPRAKGPQAFALVAQDGTLAGPFDAMLLSPAVGGALQGLGAAVRYRSCLPDRAREVAILVVAHHWDSVFEIDAHEAVGRAAGLTDAELRAVALGVPDELTDPLERAVAVTAASLCRESDLDDAQFGGARDALGERALFELTTIVGYYATLALQLRVYRVPGAHPSVTPFLTPHLPVRHAVAPRTTLS